MLVRDLIAMLQKVPQDLPAVAAGMRIQGVRVIVEDEQEAALKYAGPGARALAETFPQGYVVMSPYEGLHGFTEKT